MKTMTEYAPRLMRPSRANQPPTSMFAVKANSMAMRIIGTKDADRRIASLLASLYEVEAALTLSTSRSSAVNDLIVVMPWRLLFSNAFRSATLPRTLM